MWGAVDGRRFEQLGRVVTDDTTAPAGASHHVISLRPGHRRNGSVARLHVEHGQGPIVKLTRLRGTVGDRGDPELPVFGERTDQVKQHA